MKKPRYKRKFIPKEEEEDILEEFSDEVEASVSEMNLLTTSLLEAASNYTTVHEYTTERKSEDVIITEKPSEEEPEVIKVDVEDNDYKTIIIGVLVSIGTLLLTFGVLLCWCHMRSRKSGKPEMEREDSTSPSSWCHVITSRRSTSRSDTSSLCGSG